MSRQHALLCPCCHSTELAPDVWITDRGTERAAVECKDCGTQGYLDVWIAKSQLDGALKSLLIQILWALKCSSGTVNLALPQASAQNITRALAELDPHTAAAADMLCRNQLGSAA